MSRKKINPQKSKNKQIYIISEGKTEICYFNQLKNYKSSHSLKIARKDEWQLSWTHQEKLRISQDRVYEIILNVKWNFNKRDIKTTCSKIFYLLDIDWANKDSYSKEEIDFIRKHFEDNNITVVFTNKDIELWILLHFCEYKKEDWKYIEKILEESWYIYEKGWKQNNVDFFQKIIWENLDRAIENAKKLEKYQDKKEHIKDKNPYTEVYKIFDELES